MISCAFLHFMNKSLIYRNKLTFSNEEYEHSYSTLILDTHYCFHNHELKYTHFYEALRFS